MSTEALTTYLNDHLAGSVAALELVDHLRHAVEGTPQETFLEALRSDIQADQDVLRGLLHRSGGTESRIRKAAAWLAEKIGEAKLKLDDSGSGELRWLEALEALGLGIQGKLALWHALEAAGERKLDLQGLDIARLKQRALEQHGRIEAERIRAAKRALNG